MGLFSTNNFLKTVFLKGIHDQFPENNVFLSNLKRDSEYVLTGGSTAQWAIRDTRNAGVGAYAADGAFPTAGKQDGAQANAPLKNFAASVVLSLKLMEQAKTDKQAFVNYTADELDRSLKDFKADLNRQILNGANAQLGAVGSVAGNVITLSGTATPRYNPLTLFFTTQKIITIYQADGVTVRVASTTISNVNQGLSQITVANATGVQPGDVITGVGSGTGASGLEMTGLRDGIATGNKLFNIDPAARPLWQGNVFNAVSDPTESLLGAMRVAGAKNDAEFKFAITSWGVQLNYVAILADKKRFVNTVNLKGGFTMQSNADDKFSGPNFDGVGPIIADNYVPSGTASGTAEFSIIDPSQMFFQQAGEAKWMEDQSGNVQFPVVGFPTFNSFYNWFGELCFYSRNRLSRHTAMRELTSN